MVVLPDSKGGYIVLKSSIFAAFAIAASPAYANDVWQFNVTKDQNGSDASCNELVSIPCSITGHQTPYVLGTLTVSAALTGYATSQDIPVTTAFDDNHLISFVMAPTLSLRVLTWPPAVSTTPLLVNIAVNEVAGELSGSIYLDLDEHGSVSIAMMGINNMWAGYWRTSAGTIHQFRARSDKVLAITQH